MQLARQVKNAGFVGYGKKARMEGLYKGRSEKIRKNFSVQGKRQAGQPSLGQAVLKQFCAGCCRLRPSHCAGAGLVVLHRSITISSSGFSRP